MASSSSPRSPACDAVVGLVGSRWPTLFPSASSMLAAFSHSEPKRRTSVSSGTRSPRSLTRSEKAPPASTEPTSGRSLRQAGPSNRPSSRRPRARRGRRSRPGTLSSIMTSCPGLRRRSGDGLVRLGEPGAEPGRARRAWVGVPGEVQGETVPACGQLGDAPPLGEPLGGVLRLDPELVGEHLGRDSRGGETDHRPGPWTCSQAARRPAMAVDLPVPAGPTRTSRTRPEVAIFSTARAWSRLSL